MFWEIKNKSEYSKHNKKRNSTGPRETKDGTRKLSKTETGMATSSQVFKKNNKHSKFEQSQFTRTEDYGNFRRIQAHRTR